MKDVQKGRKRGVCRPIRAVVTGTEQQAIPGVGNVIVSKQNPVDKRIKSAVTIGDFVAESER
jgi:hypothetical protein